MENLGPAFGHAQTALLPCLAPAMLPPRRHVTGLEDASDFLGRDSNGAPEAHMSKPPLGNPGPNRGLREVQFRDRLLHRARLTITSYGHGSPRIRVHPFRP